MFIFAPRPGSAAVAKPCSATEAGTQAWRGGWGSAPHTHTGIQAGVAFLACGFTLRDKGPSRSCWEVSHGKLVTSAHGPLARARLPGVRPCAPPLPPLHEAFISKEAWQVVSLVIGGHGGFWY